MTDPRPRPADRSEQRAAFSRLWRSVLAFADPVKVEPSPPFSSGTVSEAESAWRHGGQQAHRLAVLGLWARVGTVVLLSGVGGLFTYLTVTSHEQQSATIERDAEIAARAQRLELEDRTLLHELERQRLEQVSRRLDENIERYLQQEDPRDRASLARFIVSTALDEGMREWAAEELRLRELEIAKIEAVERELAEAREELDEVEGRLGEAREQEVADRERITRLEREAARAARREREARRRLEEPTAADDSQPRTTMKSYECVLKPVGSVPTSATNVEDARKNCELYCRGDSTCESIGRVVER